uniref:C2H2-type domain-containing protein n=1 Tax=Meloidogyne javanica TaxID=6303 RepID=A0A915LQI0_MELJA
MQAHYKSYTCTQCNQDIHNSENLRSHMYRCHQIHRMFMCSLHIHMQSMQKSGKPGDVSVLARSSLDPDVKLAFPDSDGSTTNSCPEDDHQLFPEETGEISELEEQQHLQKLEENNNIREQTQRASQHQLINNNFAASSPSPSSSASVSSNNDFKNIILQHPNHHFPHPPPNHLPIAANISPQFANTNVLQSLYAAVASAASAVASTSNSASISNSASATNCSSSVSKQPLLMENIKHKKQKLQPPQKKRRGEKRKSSLNNAIIKNKNSATTTTMPTMDLSLQILQKGQNDRGAKTKKTSANNEANQEVPPNRCESLSPSMGKLNSLITNLLAIKGGNNNNNNIKQEHSPVGDDYDGNNGGESSSASERRNKRKMRTPARAAALINEKKLVNVASASNEEIKTRFETKEPSPPLQSLTKLQDNIVQLQSLSERIVSLASIKGENNSNDELLENAQKLHQILINVVEENQI